MVLSSRPPRITSGRRIRVGFGPPASRQARRERWRRQIRRRKDDHLAVAVFSRGLGVSTVTFYAWKRRFREAPLASPLFLIGPRPGPPGFFFVGTYFRLFGLCTVGNRKVRLLYAGTAAACFPPHFRS